ncbi:DUF4840 domain-containing protein [uncultured Butyricimonas sp.]|uniref:DUF4840 domain-containing protein n=1 Tax=uncultured Butyricimonas sp. TaxID=1268785 RepID=UPI0026DCB2F0|nr:DUF4840 domain-containing protein [uncultured Butyricimonas sp.]
MKKKLIGLKILSILSLVILLSGCNDDEEKISAKQIRQALFDMKGTYHGSIEVAFYHGDEIKKIDNAKAKSRDSLSFVMPLAPIADIIDDKQVAKTLRDIEEVEVKAEYEFLQIDNDGYSVHFVLIPENIVIPANGNTPDITIVLADTFGGDFEKAFNFIMFNVSPKEILVGGTKLDSFKQLVYHFRGEYE